MMSFGDRPQGASVGLNPNILPNQRTNSGYNQMSVAQPAQTYNRTGSTASSHSTSYSGQGQHNSYPINPDVRLKKLPFFDILGELLKPCTLGLYPVVSLFI